MKTYRWNGHDNIELTGVGIVHTGQTFETDLSINNEDAELITPEQEQAVVIPMQPEPIQEETAQDGGWVQNVSADTDTQVE